ncbi:hypothetical protein R69749_02113 [Paraburkholderia domus]|nr:hypothetical protein R69749_02113 [Paraburkholderia domus]
MNVQTYDDWLGFHPTGQRRMSICLKSLKAESMLD